MRQVATPTCDAHKTQTMGKDKKQLTKLKKIELMLFL
jgi:hypothetical protein